MRLRQIAFVARELQPIADQLVTLYQSYLQVVKPAQRNRGRS